MVCDGHVVSGGGYGDGGILHKDGWSKYGKKCTAVMVVFSEAVAECVTEKRVYEEEDVGDKQVHPGARTDVSLRETRNSPSGGVLDHIKYSNVVYAQR